MLVNNAGGVFETWQKTIDVNLSGLVLATQLAFEAMEGDGVIVNVSSVAALGTTAVRRTGLRRREGRGRPLHGRARAPRRRPRELRLPRLGRHAGRPAEPCGDDRGGAREVPPLVSAEEIAAIVLDLIHDDTAAGRIVVRYADESGPRVLD